MSDEELRALLDGLGERCIMQEHGLTGTTKDQEVERVFQLIKSHNQQIALAYGGLRMIPIRTLVVPVERSSVVMSSPLNTAIAHVASNFKKCRNK